MSIIEELVKKTVFELRAYAKQNNIDLVGVSTKADILEIILNFIPKETQEVVVDKKTVKEKVALFSERNIYWNGVGELTKGYNIVTIENADKWLTRQTVRSASPEEVKRAYGK